MNNPLHKIKKLTEDIYSGLTSTLKESKFYEEGVLTPEEYIEAGDFLISKCPSWQWCASEEKLYDKRLPKNKQYLKTNVPSYKRCSEYLKNNATTEKIVEGDWVDAEDVEEQLPVVLGNSSQLQQQQQKLLLIV